MIVHVTGVQSLDAKGKRRESKPAISMSIQRAIFGRKLSKSERDYVRFFGVDEVRIPFDGFLH